MLYVYRSSTSQPKMTVFGICLKSKSLTIIKALEFCYIAKFIFEDIIARTRELIQSFIF